MTPQFLGQYRIDAQLAQAPWVGYRAYDNAPAPDSRPSSSCRMSPRDCRAAAARRGACPATLNHPNICTFTKSVKSMACLHRDGGTSTGDVDRPDSTAGLPLETVLDYGSQIADAVAFAQPAASCIGTSELECRDHA